MKKSIIILIILIILIVLLLILAFFFRGSLTGNIIKENEEKIYSYTKAICNETNYCQDTEIICKGNQTIDRKPITGAAVQFHESWQDPRTKEQIERDC